MTKKKNGKNKKGLSSKLSWQKSKNLKMSKSRIIGVLVIQMMKMIMQRKILRIKTTSIRTQVKEGNVISMKKKSVLMMTHRRESSMMMTMMTRKQEFLRMHQSTTSLELYHRLHSSLRKKTLMTHLCQGFSILTFHSKSCEKCT